MFMRKRPPLTDSSAAALAETFKVLGDTTNLRILDALSEQGAAQQQREFARLVIRADGAGLWVRLPYPAQAHGQHFPPEGRLRVYRSRTSGLSRFLCRRDELCQELRSRGHWRQKDCTCESTGES